MTDEREISVLRKAAAEWWRRALRQSQPSGAMDKAGRWYPTPSERQDCCASVRDPSRSYPWSLMKHCRSALHVARLYGVDPVQLRRAVRLMRAERVMPELARAYEPRKAKREEGNRDAEPTRSGRSGHDA